MRQVWLGTLIKSLVLAISCAEAADEVSRQDLLQVLHASDEPLHDLEFVYEGSLRVLAAPDWDRVPPRNRLPGDPLKRRMEFQGRFAMQSPDLAHLDLFVWEYPGAENGPRRKIYSMPGNDKVMEQGLSAVSSKPGAIKEQRAWIGQFFSGEQPLHFYVKPYLISMLQQSSYEYRCRGWEVVSGRSCLAIDLVPVSGGSAESFWIDLERDGHPLQWEYRSRDDLLRKITDVALQQVSLSPDSRIWLPVWGRYLNYKDVSTVLQKPVREETMGIVKGTLLLNQHPDKSRFDLSYRAEEADAPPEWKRHAAESRTARLELSRLTPTQRLERMLEKANEQEIELRASTPSRASWLARNLTQFLLLGIGSGLLSAAILILLRGRRIA